MIVAVYGGTFDPPHSTHLAIARAVLERGLADKVLFVLSAMPPHKLGRQISPYEDRLAMLKLAIQGEPRFEISEIERERLPRPSYTIDTLDSLSAASPNDSFALLIGSDSLNALHTWRRGSELASRYRIISYPRKGEPATLESLKAHWSEEIAEKLRSSLLEGVPETDLSSSSLRSALANSGNAGKCITEAVLSCIRERGLYLEPRKDKQQKPESIAYAAKEED